MDEMKNKMDDMEMDKVSGGKIFPRPRPGCHDSNTNSMAANVMGGTENANSAAGKYLPPLSMAANVDLSMAANIDETQNARWREIAKVKPD